MRFKAKSTSLVLLLLTSFYAFFKLLSRLPTGANQSADIDGGSNGPTKDLLSEYGWIRPNIYEENDPVEIIVNKIESDLTQFPYAYYELPFTCPPTNVKKPLHLSLNEIIRGDRKWQSDYLLHFKKDEHCLRLCDRKTSPDALRKAHELIKQGYVVQWLIDDELPAATTFISTKDHKKYYASGFPLGFMDKDTGKTYLNNHVMLVIRYHTVDINKFTIVGLEVYPKSVSDYHCPGASKNFDHYEVNTEETETTYIPFTYSIYWREEFNVDWTNRWNFFINSGEISQEKSSQFHWISLANNVVIVTLVTLVVALILAKSVSTDETVSTSTSQVASQWVVQRSYLLNHLNVFTAMGVQFLFTILGSLIISCSMNKLHNIRNSVLTMALMCFISGAYTSSFVGALLSANHNTTIKISIACGSALPGFTLCVVLILNCIIWAKDSTHALPFGTIVLLITVYFIVCIPLSILGGVSATYTRRKCLSLDPRSIINRFFLLNIHYDDQSLVENKVHLPGISGNSKLPLLLRQPVLLTVISGIVPFIVIYVELLFVYKSLWLEKTTFYYLYGFLLANIVLLCVVVCEISIIGCYLTLIHVSPDEFIPIATPEQAVHSPLLKQVRAQAVNFVCSIGLAMTQWRWKSFQIGGSVAWYLEAYSLYYFLTVLKIRDFSSILLFFCYSALFNFLCWCSFGALGYLSCCWFVNRIHTNSKRE